MITKVEFIRKHPLNAIRLGDEQYQAAQQEKPRQRGGMLAGSWGLLTQTIQRGKGMDPDNQSDHWKARRKPSKSSVRHPKHHKKLVLLETKILENTIIKLGSLLALGF